MNGKVMTVLGPITPEELGITLTHGHLGRQSQTSADMGDCRIISRAEIVRGVSTAYEVF